MEPTARISPAGRRLSPTMEWVIIAGVLVYALTLYTLIRVCDAAGSFQRFYDQLVDVERPRDDELPRGSGGGVQ